MICVVERWKMTVVLLLSLLLTGLAYVGDLCAQIKKDEVDFEVMATVTMKKGDSLWVIAQQYYGDPLKWTYIKDMNKIANEARIPVGTVIYIPVKDAKRIVKQVEEEIVKKKTVEEELSEKIAELQKELDAVREESKKCNAESEQLTKELKDKDATVKDLEGMLDNVKAAMDKIKAETESELEAQANEMRAAAKKHEEELREAKEAGGEVEDLRSELRRCRGDIERLERARDELNAKIRRAEEEAAKRPPVPVKKPVEARSRVAAVAIALVGSIIWMASN
jgi:predicted RNase H-like nuclease (RuvC/YqgF family)